ncbi:MAG: hypothetical protein ABR592_13615 [Nitriliruptorales bacterium]
MAEETAEQETAQQETDQTERVQRRERTSPRIGLVYALGAGMSFWGVHIAGMPAVTPYICHTEQTILWHLLSVGTIIPILPALSISWRYWKSEESTEGVAFLGQIGIILNLLSIMAILLEWAPVFFLHPCLS